ncbi:Cupredoxin [Clohesyomyces aquaticus]|uniref:Cupredoxin n=1 Tax=Clohesyomyces aquaticus TaxID=1231657 RepID=A0A1Y1ZUQ6_9PLEO|nr:Cupredoxin [Clohesyomyces aquaticus]
MSASATAASVIAASESTVSAAAAATGAAGGAAGMVATHVVQVGGANGSLIFSPSNVIAEPGDLVQFQFNAKNHSLVQSTFDNPCIPIQMMIPNKTDAFFSGFMPTNRTITQTTNVLTYTVRVTNKAPMWYYCSQGKHCQAGMVGAINAATSGNKTVAAFKEIAAKASENITPSGGQAGGNGEGAPAASGAASSAAGGEGGAAATATESGAGAGGAQASATTTGVALSTGAAGSLFHDVAARSALGLGLGAFAAFFVL